VTLWYSDSTTDDVDAGLQVVSTLTGTYLGVTGQDFVSGPFLQPNGIADWHIHLQGLRGIPARLRITSTSGGIWESPFNGTNWIVATQYAANGAGDLWFDPFSANTSFHVKVWYSDGAVDETDVGTFDFPSTLKATYLGITGEDFVGSNGSLAANGNPDWHIQLQGLRATPTKVRVTADPIGTWEAPFNGTNWLVATQYETGGAGGLWFEPYVTPTRFHVTVWYADGTTDEIDAL
jgi:ATP phosphoribosyltransferase